MQVRAWALLLALGQFALVTSVFMITGIISELAESFDVSIARAGQAIAAFSLTYAVSAPVLAALFGKYSPKWILISTMAVFAASNIAVLAVSNFDLLLILRIVAAAADGLFAATASATAARLAPPEQKGRVLALVNSGVTLAFVLGVPLTTLVAEQFDWQAAFITVAGIAAVSLTGLLVLFPDSLPNPSISIRERLLVLTKPPIVLTLLVTSMSYLGLFIVYNYLGPIAASSESASEFNVSTLLFIFGVSTIFGNLVGGWAADSVGVKKTVIVSLIVLAAVLSAQSLFFQSEAGVVAMLVAWGAVHYASLPPLQRRLADLADENAGVALALMGSAVYLGVAGGALIGGVFLQSEWSSFIGPLGGSFKLLGLAFFLLSYYVNRTISER